tara:strand:- start:744 stop:1208 length:465 start_codon:yes stop_codon:yes gene_type:complete
MVSCPSCKTKISSSAKTCPFCGATGEKFERSLKNWARMEAEEKRKKREEFERKLEKDKKLTFNCKSCSKKLKKYLKYPELNPDIFIKGLVNPVAFCSMCYKNHLNNQFHGLILLYRKNPSFTWQEMSGKNKIVSYLQIIFIIVFIIIFIYSGGV